MIELLVVIGIIALLASILFPVIGKVRESAREADTRALIGSIDAACQTYKQDFNAYPGPLPNAYITAQDQVNFGIAPAMWRNSDTGLGLAAIGTAAANPNGFNDAQVSATGVVADGQRVTAAENLVLGLLGGVAVNKATANSYFLEFDPAAVGQGAASLSSVRAGRSGNYMQNASLSGGFFEDPDLRRDENTTGTGTTYVQGGLTPPKDSRIPEFVDRFSQPMPILVLRSRTGGRGDTTVAYGVTNNDVIVNLPSSVAAAVNGQYNLVDITPYTQSQIGLPHSLKSSKYVPAYDPKKPHGLIGDPGVAASTPLDSKVQYPYVDPVHYFADPASIADASETDAQKRLKKMKARKQDQIILISAGRDRVYGTDDDVTNFGSVKP